MMRLRFAYRRGMATKLRDDAKQYAGFCRRLAVKSNVVMYESYAGAGMVCNPLAIFHELQSRPDMARLRHVWAIADEESLRRLRREHANSRNVRFVLYGSTEYLRTLATAKWLVQNTSFPFYFAKRPGQVALNTWHSITVKTLGFDMPNGNYESRNIIRGLLASDFILSPNPFMTTIFRDSYRLDGAFRGEVIETGFPRCDLGAGVDRARLTEELAALGVRVDPDREIVLYAPTWRGRAAASARADVEVLERVRERLEEALDTSRYQLLIKPHHVTYRAMTAAERSRGGYVPRGVDPNRLLAITDILVSDYSSIFFEFLPTGRPILFYIPDRDHYESERGTYFGEDQLPGPVTDDVQVLASWLEDVEREVAPFRPRYEQMRDEFLPYDDGGATGRVVDRVFYGRPLPEGSGTSAVAPGAGERTSILFYVAGFAGNGVTSAFTTLLDRIDRSRYDVTIFAIPADAAARARLEALTDVRVLARCGGLTLTRWEAIAIEYARRYGFNGPLTRILRPEIPLEREFRRCFGDARFDHLVDYSGYGLLYPSVLRTQSGPTKSIWQHSDMLQDISNREKRALRKYRGSDASKTGMINTYSGFDHIVACGSSILEVNRRNLSTKNSWSRFTYCNNLIDGDRVRRMLSEPDVPRGERSLQLQTYGLRGGVESIVVLNLDDGPRPGSGLPYRRFVTMGRLSPEKNHARLIRAFAQFVREYPNARLFIVGHGDLRGSLQALIHRLDMNDHVALVGQLANPFRLMRNCDCFVLPSLYEGFGLVVQEARIVGLPLILSEFSAVGSVTFDGGQLLVGFEEEDILAGFKAFVHGQVPAPLPFDDVAHNDDAYRQFEALFPARRQAAVTAG